MACSISAPGAHYSGPDLAIHEVPHQPRQVIRAFGQGGQLCLCHCQTEARALDALAALKAAVPERR